MTGAVEGPIAAAAARAPDTPAVYFLLAADTELLYVGKAGQLRRRLHQHARDTRAPGGPRLDVLYQQVSEVRWEEQPDEAAAEAREADLIAGLRPRFNAGSALAGRWTYLLVQPADRQALHFQLTHEPDPLRPGGRAYGCFPHLGRGLASRPGTACSDGYPALLRLLWAASDVPGNHIPRRITRTAPDAFTTPVPPSLRAALHAFLSGTSGRLLGTLGAAAERLDGFLSLAQARDRRAAASFFAYGPYALRQLRLRNGRRAGPMPRSVFEELLVAELRQTIGEFRLPAPPDPTDAFLGRKAQPWTRSTPDRTAMDRTR